MGSLPYSLISVRCCVFLLNEGLGGMDMLSGEEEEETMITISGANDEVPTCFCFCFCFWPRPLIFLFRTRVGGWRRVSKDSMGNDGANVYKGFGVSFVFPYKMFYLYLRHNRKVSIRI